MAAEMTRAEEMSPEYRATILQLMESQAYRELAAAHMFGYGLRFVPEKWLRFMVWHIKEETDHYEAVAKMYREFTGEGVEPVVQKRLAGKPVPFAESWFELAMAQFLYDRGGFWQLKEYDACTFVPYRGVIQKIVKEEAGHQELGEKIVVEMCQSGGHEDVKQPLFEKWLRIGLLSFGRPNTPGNRFAIENGIKKRDSGLCMQDFVNDIKPAVKAAGLHFPAPEALAMELPAGLDWSL
ncbi:MAG: phenylacetate-CoA oxygenase subunit PaaI [Vicinamibacteria bacterium]|nr:phenylacetate-CoA oxygenase subunit PaaI [Vicinamibacteria bacterium]